MPVKPGRQCRFPGCPAVVSDSSGYCPEHQRQVSVQYERTRETAVKRGYDTRWNKIRKMVLAASPMCQCEDCKGRRLPADCVHHLNGNPKDNRMENLLAMNGRCHSRMHLSIDRRAGLK